MKFKNLDWELEARRVARAFGVDEKCDWFVSAGGRVLRFEGKHFVFLRDDLVLTLSYSNRSRDFMFSYQQSQKWRKMGIVFDWDGAVLVNTPLERVAPLLSRALFHLDLLSPEVETVLNVHITAHQKLEWLREYQKRYGL